MRAPALLAAAALLCAGCGGGRDGPSGASTRPWRSNAAGALAQLRSDVAETSLGGDTRAQARQALADTSDLYLLLVAYSDLGGCTSMIEATGAPRAVAHELARPCRRLEHAAALFTRATGQSDPAALVEAARQARGAEAQLVRALLVLRREP